VKQREEALGRGQQLVRSRRLAGIRGSIVGRCCPEAGGRSPGVGGRRAGQRIDQITTICGQVGRSSRFVNARGRSVGTQLITADFAHAPHRHR
jgi:hypothetical protein